MADYRPTIVCIPGFWHTSEYFNPLATLLRQSGYPTTLVNLPSAGAHPGDLDFSRDVAAIRSTVIALISSGKDVVLVMHSGGSVSGSEALKGLDKIEQGKGTITRVVYIGILLPKSGMTMFERFMGVITSPDLDPEFILDQDQTFHVIAEVFIPPLNDICWKRILRPVGWHINNHQW